MYALKADWQRVVETCVGAYLGVSAFVLAGAGQPLTAVLLATFASGFLYLALAPAGRAPLRQRGVRSMGTSSPPP